MAKDARGNAAGEDMDGERSMGVVSFGGDLSKCEGLLAIGVLGDMRGDSTSSEILWGNVNHEWMGIGGTTHVTRRVVGLPAPYVGRSAPLFYISGGYSVEFDRWSVGAVKRPASGCSRNRVMKLLLGVAWGPPPPSPVTNPWTDVWVIDKLHSMVIEGMVRFCG